MLSLLRWLVGCYHKWDKWGEPVCNKYVNTGEPYFVQTRTCERCGKEQIRVYDLGG